MSESEIKKQLEAIEEAIGRAADALDRFLGRTEADIKPAGNVADVEEAWRIINEEVLR